MIMSHSSILPSAMLTEGVKCDMKVYHTEILIAIVYGKEIATTHGPLGPLVNKSRAI